VIRALILDFDGLVIDSETAVAQAWREVFGREGFALPETLWRSMVGTRENDGVLWTELERLSGVRFTPEGDAARRERGVEIASKLPLLPGVRGLLDEAGRAGLRLGIASSSSRWWVEGHLGRLEILDRFEVIRTKEDAERSKPFPDIYRATLEALGLSAEHAVAFEDSAPGVAAAKAAGLKVVAVPGSFTEHMDFSMADEVVPTLEGRSLEELLRSM